MLLKEVGKITAGTGWSPSLVLQWVLWHFFIVFMYTILKKIEEKAGNSEGSLNFVVLEKNAELAMWVESLLIEML